MVGLIAFITSAQASTNISDEDYARLKHVFSDARIATMSEEEVQKYLSYDLENSITAQKYYKVTEGTNGFTYTEVSEEEAANAFNNEGISTYGITKETNYKKIYISATNMGGNKYLMNMYTQWKVTPAVKSFDVTAFRTDDATVQDGTQSGTQIYWTSSSGTYQVVNYSANGTNIKKASNGFGISMNLVDDASYFECDLDALVVATSKYATVYGSYQHAVRDMTLAQSQSYSISHNGLGKVINFYPDVEPYYDRMGGVDIALPYNA